MRHVGAWTPPLPPHHARAHVARFLGIFVLTDGSDRRRQCLKGRRVIFLGDSLANQQADSLVGMLDWHPSFLTRDDPQNSKVWV